MDGTPRRSLSTVIYPYFGKNVDNMAFDGVLRNLEFG